MEDACPAPIPVLLMGAPKLKPGRQRAADGGNSQGRSTAPSFDPRVGLLPPGGLARGRPARRPVWPIGGTSRCPRWATVKGAISIAASSGSKIYGWSTTFRHAYERLWSARGAHGRFPPVVVSSQRRTGRCVRHATGMHCASLIAWVDGIVVNCEFLRRHLRDDEKTPAGVDPSLLQRHRHRRIPAFTRRKARCPARRCANSGGGVRPTPRKGTGPLCWTPLPRCAGLSLA